MCSFRKKDKKKLFSYFGIDNCKKKNPKNLPESVLQSQRLVSLSFHGKHFHQELKGNGDGSFDGRVQRKREQDGRGRQAGSQFPHTQGKLRLKETQRFGQLCSGKHDCVCSLSTKKAAPRTDSPPLPIIY